MDYPAFFGFASLPEMRNFMIALPIMPYNIKMQKTGAVENGYAGRPARF
jgi:hypothetical protein